MISRGVRANEGTQDLQRESGKDAIQLGGIFVFSLCSVPLPPSFSSSMGILSLYSGDGEGEETTAERQQGGEKRCSEHGINYFCLQLQELRGWSEQG